MLGAFPFVVPGKTARCMQLRANTYMVGVIEKIARTVTGIRDSQKGRGRGDRVILLTRGSGWFSDESKMARAEDGGGGG